MEMICCFISGALLSAAFIIARDIYRIAARFNNIKEFIEEIEYIESHY